jgi:hypothetical protein
MDYENLFDREQYKPKKRRSKKDQQLEGGFGFNDILSIGKKAVSRIPLVKNVSNIADMVGNKIPLINNIRGAIGMGKNGLEFIPYDKKKYQLALERALETSQSYKGGYVHRPSIGSGFVDDESYIGGRGFVDDNADYTGGFGLSKEFGDGFYKGTKYVTQPVQALGALASLTPAAPYAIPITAGMAAYENLVKTLSGNGLKERLTKGGLVRLPNTRPFPPPHKLPPQYQPYDNNISLKGGKKKSARGEIVKQVMSERGLNLAQASRFVKENNLY